MAAPVDRTAEAEAEDEEENGLDTVRCTTCEISEVMEGSAEVREHSLARCGRLNGNDKQKNINN